MTHNAKFSTKMWVRLAQNSQFWSFCSFFPIMRLRFVLNGHFHAIHNFSHLLPPKLSHFIQNLKNVHFWGEGTSENFLSFSTFWILFTPNWLKIPTMVNFAKKVGYIGSKWPSLVILQVSPHNYP